MRTSLLGLTRDCAAATRQALLGALASAPAELVLDFAEIRALDSAGAALLTEVLALADLQGCRVWAEGVHPSIARSLAVFPGAQPNARPGALPARAHEAAEAAEVSAVAATDATCHAWLADLGDGLARAAGWLAEGAALVLALLRHVGDILRGRCRAPWAAACAEMHTIGAQAVSVVGLISFLVGVTVAMQSAAQLRQFGASIFVVDLMALAITRELGPLMAAILVAGRSGSAAAAQIATMVITEEVDALKTMGIDPVRYVVLPKVLAIAITQPLLTVLANAVAIGASVLVAFFYLDIAPATFADRLFESLMLKDVVLGLGKSICFGLATMALAALLGLRTRGGADAVGRSTTASVVASIFAIILIDAAFSLLFYLEL